MFFFEVHGVVSLHNEAAKKPGSSIFERLPHHALTTRQESRIPLSNPMVDAVVGLNIIGNGDGEPLIQQSRKIVSGCLRAKSECLVDFRTAPFLFLDDLYNLSVLTEESKYF